jgi:transposase-like protein
VAQRFSGFEDPAESNGAAIPAEDPPQSMDNGEPRGDEASLGELEEDAFPSYSSPPPSPEAADFKTPWDPKPICDSEIQPWKPPRVTEQQKTAIDLILCGKKLEKVAQQLGIHRGTLWRWRRHNLDFRAELSIARAKAFQHAIEQLRELVPKAVDVVHSQIESGDHRAAFQLLRFVVNVHRDAMDPV